MKLLKSQLLRNGQTAELRQNETGGYEIWLLDPDRMPAIVLDGGSCYNEMKYQYNRIVNKYNRKRNL
jgi:hypothetical protein